MSGVEKFDPSTLMQGVKDRIKATFVSLIPDEQWAEMCEKEIKKFFTETERGYNNREYYSDFMLVVNEVLREETKARVKEILVGPEFSVNYKDNGMTIPELLRAELVKRAPDIFISAIQNAIGNAIQNARHI